MNLEAFLMLGGSLAELIARLTGTGLTLGPVLERVWNLASELIGGGDPTPIELDKVCKGILAANAGLNLSVEGRLSEIRQELGLEA